jgi:hypothetical protein
MIISIFTNYNNTYFISNNPEDNGCPYVTEDNALYIFLTNPENIYFDYKTEDITYPHISGDKEFRLYLANPRSLFFNYKNAAIMVPYTMIENVIYGDEIGEELAYFILSKKQQEEIVPPAPPPPPPPPPPPELISISRDKRVIGDQVYTEIPLFDPDIYLIAS